MQNLERELAGLPYLPRYQPIAMPDGPFEIRVRTNGPAEASRIDAMIESIGASIVRLRSAAALDEVRAAIRYYRAVNRRPYSAPVARRGRRQDEWEDCPF